MDTMPQQNVICGVDTHADCHVAAVADSNGRVVAVETFDTTSLGIERLIDWLTARGNVIAAGVEGTSSYGKGLARALHLSGIPVREVIRPNRQTRRRHGKSDPADAIAAARAVLSGEASAIPKSGDGPIEAIRILQIARSSAIKARSQAANQIRDLICTGPDDLKDRLFRLGTKQLVDACTRLRITTHHNQTETAIRTALRSLAKRHQSLTNEINDFTRQLETLTTTTAPTLTSLKGVGPDVAAKLLIAAGDNPHRLRSEAAWAHLCGVAPIPASSGKTQRHRLNRGGNRQANSAIYRIMLTRRSNDERTRTYIARRTAEGKTIGEIARMLKRYIAREVFKTLPTTI